LKIKLCLLIIDHSVINRLYPVYEDNNQGKNIQYSTLNFQWSGSHHYRPDRKL